MSTPSSLESNSRQFRLLTAMGIAIIAWGLGRIGIFHGIDELAYDRFMKLRSRLHPGPAKVLLVEIGDPESIPDPVALLRLLELLEQLGAAQVVFTFLPPESAAAVYEKAEVWGKVIFPRTLAPDRYEPERLIWGGRMDPRAHRGLPFGILHTLPATGGVHRSQYSGFKIQDVWEPALEALAARLFTGESPAGIDPEYLVDFRGGSGSLPNLSMKRVLEGDAIQEVVRGRSVLIGAASTLPDPGIFTPTTEGMQVFSLLEYQGHALNTLLTGRLIHPLGVVPRISILLILAILSDLAYRWFSIKTAGWLTAASMLAHFTASGALFCLAGLWVPPTEVMVSQAGIAVVTLRGAAIQLTRAMHSVITDTSAQMRDRYWPIRFRSQASPWPLIANMINQTLDLNRLIFLEADTRSGKLKEILALHCSLEDILERRRDYLRSPYSDALNRKGPLKVKNFLQTSNPEEDQFLSPLTFAGELLGFWALGIERSKVEAIAHFDTLMRDYSARISEILHQTRQETRQESGLAILRRKLATECTDETFQQLNSTLGLLQHRLATIDTLIHRLNSGIVLYDIFGRILQINDVMVALLKKEGIAPFEMTALDLILALSNYDISKSRKILRRVIVEGSPISFPVIFRSASMNRFFMHLRFLGEEDAKELGPQPQRIASRSILCELVDTTQLTHLYEMKSRLTERLGLKLRNDLASIDLSAVLLGGGRVRSEERPRIARIAQGKVRETLQALGECRQYLALDSDSDDLERFPVDPKISLQASLEEAQELVSRRGLELKVMLPNFVSYVFASSTKLMSLFGAILKVLCQDAVDRTTILVRVSESEGIVAFDFSNTGFGIPGDLLRGYLFGEQQPSTEEFQRIKTAVRWVESWGGLLEAASDIGVGIHFTVHLVKFI